MSASLVGSEMCIRDSTSPSASAPSPGGGSFPDGARTARSSRRHAPSPGAEPRCSRSTGLTRHRN
eukprot:13188348-Alexandrium_andersonii.AAC.1